MFSLRWFPKLVFYVFLSCLGGKGPGWSLLSGTDSFTHKKKCIPPIKMQGTATKAPNPIPAKAPSVKVVGPSGFGRELRLPRTCRSAVCGWGGG